MQPLTTFKQFSLYSLSPELVKTYFPDIARALDQIPSVEPHTLELLLAESKGERILFSKWQHSLIALDDQNSFAGIIIGYERKNENNEQYPQNTIYLSDLAVSSDFQKQGLGKFLVEAWLDHNKQLGFINLDGELAFSVQTNSADWNRHVQALYESFGFRKIATKTYDNRVDNVYLLE